jgi:chorismate-pyruvate lyase
VQLGEFTEVTPEEMPQPARRLLAHNDHMTVTVEEFHGSLVNVRVLDKLVTPRHYARKILLERQSDGLVVQYGIMRVNFEYLSPEVAREIQSEATPLGRILIEHNVLRRVQLFSLWRVEMGEELQRLFGAGPGTAYARTAMIDCNEEPAVELVEIVTPLDL